MISANISWKNKESAHGSMEKTRNSYLGVQVRQITQNGRYQYRTATQDWTRKIREYKGFDNTLALYARILVNSERLREGSGNG